jgi:hypothetical protein
VLGIKPRALPVVGKHSSTEPHPQLPNFLLGNSYLKFESLCPEQSMREKSMSEKRACTRGLARESLAVPWSQLLRDVDVIAARPIRTSPSVFLAGTIWGC